MLPRCQLEGITHQNAIHSRESIHLVPCDSLKSEYSGLAEQLPPLSAHEALVESNRCLYCYDAPCTHACPTHIDVPRFIRKIATGNLGGSANAILEANLLGATCSRVCPVQELCEGACVLGSEHRPIAIGRLQRYAMDQFYASRAAPFPAETPRGKKVAIVGAGAAGLSCAGELLRRGYSVRLFEKRQLAGGLSTYGIIGLREPMEVALAEVAMLQRAGLELETERELGRDFLVPDLQSEFSAVFLGVGQGYTPTLAIPGEEQILDGIQYVEASKLNAQTMRIGFEVLVIGAGNTAIDCATVARRLGARKVTIVYRRSEADMSAYPHEYQFAKNEGIEFQFHAQPVAVMIENGLVSGLQCVSTDGSSSRITLRGDQIVKAIGQERPALAHRVGLRTERGFIAVDENFETSMPGIYAGGDCIRAQGVCSTVMAVEDGKLAARAIDRKLSGEFQAREQNG